LCAQARGCWGKEESETWGGELVDSFRGIWVSWVVDSMVPIGGRVLHTARQSIVVRLTALRRQDWPDEQAGPTLVPVRRVGFLGVGRMGLPMCANLVKAGHDVTAGDLRAELEEAVRAAGARWERTPAAVAAGADVLITMLPGPREVRDALLEPGGALDALPGGATWIDTSSGSPAVGREIAERARARSIGVLDAPVSGGVPAAEAGSLQLFVGGDEALLRRHRPLLEAVADRIVHVGEHGAGYTTKLLVNLLWFGQAVATAEALLLGRRAGIDLDVLRDALASSPASSEFIRRDLEAVLTGDHLESFELDRCVEELETLTTFARGLGVPFALSELVEHVHRRALSRYGPVAGELLAVALLEEEGGISLRRSSLLRED
jgi:3-hydroxyisobutyrate dehydrogenase